MIPEDHQPQDARIYCADNWSPAMTVSSFLVRNITQPAWAIYDGNWKQLRYKGNYSWLEHYSPEQLRESQLTRLRVLLQHAASNTRYYEELFSAIGFNPADLQNFDDLKRLPELNKAIIRQRFDDLVAGNIPPKWLLKASTGGSTGVPLTFMRDRDCVYQRRAQELFFDGWMGYRAGDKAALFVAASHHDSLTDQWKARFRNATCERLLRFDPHHITEEYLSQFVHEFRRFKPTFIKCFPNSLAVFARYVSDKGIELPAVNGISCTGENLYPEQKELFSSTFGAPVFEKYGTKDAGIIACECRMHDGLHLFTEGAVVELVDASGREVGPGEMGRILVTDLFNRAMPLIRYDIGDMAVAAGSGACGCGSALPRIQGIVGRDRDILVDEQGNPKPGYLFVEVINSAGLDAQFQIIQKNRADLIIRIAGTRPDDSILEKLRKSFAEITGPSIPVRFEFVDTIKRDPSGKYRYVAAVNDSE